MTETPSPNPRQILADLIDAYAASKVSANEMLQRMSIGALNEFINTHDIVPLSASDEGVEPEGEQQ